MIIVFSDIHLRTESQPWEKSFLDTLERYLKDPRSQHVVLVGDILDICAGGRHPWHTIYPRFFSLIKNTSVPILYVEGNHDFRLKSAFPFSHVTCIDKHATVHWGQKRFFLAHGDRMDESLGYRLLYGWIRSHPLRWLMNHTPLRLVLWVARYLSRYSRTRDITHLSHHTGLRLRFHEFVQQKWREGFDGVILGHNHSVEHLGSEHHIYLNCGFWPRDRTYFEITPSPWEVKKRTASNFPD